MKVLVIEHDKRACENMVDQLSRLSRVTGVRSAQTAIEAEAVLLDFTASVIFLDLQMPDKSPFELVDRTWPGEIPVIVCITDFDNRLVRGLQAHRVEHLIRPFGREDLLYTVTRGHRPDPVNADDNLARVLALGKELGMLSRREVFAFRKSRTTFLEVEDIGAIHYCHGSWMLWTASGVWETNTSCLRRILHRRKVRRLYRNGIAQKDTNLSLRDMDRARRWLWRRACLDVFLQRPGMPDSALTQGITCAPVAPMSRGARILPWRKVDATRR